MIRLGKVISDTLLILGKSLNEENPKTALTSVVLPSFYFIKVCFFSLSDGNKLSNHCQRCVQQSCNESQLPDDAR